MNLIERVLQEHSLNTEQSILMGQWEFDKKNIPSALKAIAIVFPHFSLHDETHSVSILNNIVKMLGEEAIAGLSCTDLWLLLESAYCHDLGMVVTSDRLEEALESKAFVEHFLKISVDENHPCHGYSKNFQVKDGKLYFKEEEFKTNQLDAIRLLLADYYRSRHAENSKKTILNPAREAGIESPRSIIPARLFDLLSSICNAHTQDFESVMALPKNEDGIGLDECHPRFIACMLRMGDLLDIDNNRFSETLMKTIKRLPSDSQSHYEKHRSISHLSISSKSIEIEAKCKTPLVAKVLQDWFDWISEEIKIQTLKWNSIVPDGLECYLPTLNYLRVQIDGYETVKDSKKQRLTIDTAKALELLQGKNFYKDAFDSIREILQNSVDSTLLRIYLDSKKDNKKFDVLGKDFLNYASHYPITVIITEDKDRYSFEVRDMGIGLKRDQLQYLINAGSSSKNVEKKLIVDEMPEWMRPSGVFGIGFQSVFLLTDKVEVLTKDYFQDEKMWLEMYSPNSRMKGDVYLKKVTGPIDTGFTIRFMLPDDIEEKTAKDPFNAFRQSIKMSMVDYRIRQYAAKSVVPIIIEHREKGRVSVETIERDRFDFFDKETGIELRFVPEVFHLGQLTSTRYFYRNAEVSASGSGIMFLCPEVNLHFGSANDILTLDRGAVKDEKTVSQRTIDAVVNFMNSGDYRKLMDRLGNLAQIAAFLFSFFVEYHDRKKDIKRKDGLPDVNSFSLESFGAKKTVNDIVSSPSIRIRTSSKQVLQLDDKDGSLVIEGNLIPIVSPSFIVNIFKLLIKLVSDSHSHCYCTERIRNSIFGGAEYLFTNEDVIPDIKLSMNDIKPCFDEASSRSYVYYLPQYEDIRIATDKNNPAIHEAFITQPIPNLKLEKIISPFIKLNNALYDCRNEELYKYVSNETGKDIISVQNAYDRFVSEAIALGVRIKKKDD